MEETRQREGLLYGNAVQKITEILGVQPEEIKEIEMLKKGMTNRSVLFSCKGERYIMRMPGEGTSCLINRKEEFEVYSVIRGKGICDEICYIDPEGGYKLTKYITNARTCDPGNMMEVLACIRRLRGVHEQKLTVGHTFDVFGKILYYESLRNGGDSCYPDYEETKKKIWELKDYIEAQPKEWGLAHMDAVSDNFLLYENGNGQEEICLIDWEYAAMQDVPIDIAMFVVYSMYGRDDIDRIIDFYFEGKCDQKTRRKIYAYIAVCGLLWSNWCEYKRQNGVEFGEYALWQYRYAKEYYQIWKGTCENEN